MHGNSREGIRCMTIDNYKLLESNTCNLSMKGIDTKCCEHLEKAYELDGKNYKYPNYYGQVLLQQIENSNVESQAVQMYERSLVLFANSEDSNNSDNNENANKFAKRAKFYV